jgi:hypothetical protein
MESPLQSSNKKVFTFSAISASPLEMVQVLCQYLEQEGCSECRPTGVISMQPFRWQKTVTILSDFVPLWVEVKVEEKGGEIFVTISDLSLNDVIRCTRMCNDMCKFVKGNGFIATCKQQLTSCFRLLDDDFDMIIQSELHSGSKEVDIDLVDIDACRCDLREEELQAISGWSTSKMESVSGLAKSTTSIADLLHMANLVDTHPSVASLRSFVTLSA